MFEGYTRIGIAHSPYITTLLRKHPDVIDYIEVPFELLRYDPSVIKISKSKPIILHCASMSIAGTVLPTEQTIQSIKHWIDRTETPWLGEHLSFITAEKQEADLFAEEYAPGEPYNIGYTVSPPMNEETIELVIQSVDLCQKRFRVPLLLENTPIYFTAPGSTMTQIQFIQSICKHTSVNLLLDLAHFYITSQTMNFDPNEEILRLPLERVVEVHLSGVEFEAQMYWDNHAARAPKELFDLLSIVLRCSRVSAVTLEYNWSSRFPFAVLLEEIDQARKLIIKFQRKSE